MEYTFTQDENYKDSMAVALKGQVSDQLYRMLITLLEMIVMDRKVSTYTISLTVDASTIGIQIDHQGKAVENSVIDIIDDQVDDLYYYHETKDSHILKLKIKRY